MKITIAWLNEKSACPADTFMGYTIVQLVEMINFAKSKGYKSQPERKETYKHFVIQEEPNGTIGLYEDGIRVKEINF